MFSKKNKSINNKYDDIHHYYNKLKKDYQETTDNLNYIYNNLDDYKYNKEELDDIKVSLLNIEKTLENDLYKTLAKGNLSKQIKNTLNKTTGCYIGYRTYEMIGDENKENIVICGEDENYDNNEISYTSETRFLSINFLLTNCDKDLYPEASYALKASNYKLAKSSYNKDKNYYLFEYNKEYIQKQVKQLKIYNNMMELEMFDVVINNLEDEISNLNKLNDEINYFKSKINGEIDNDIDNEIEEFKQIDKETEIYQKFNDLLNDVA